MNFYPQEKTVVKASYSSLEEEAPLISQPSSEADTPQSRKRVTFASHLVEVIGAGSGKNIVTDSFHQSPISWPCSDDGEPIHLIHHRPDLAKASSAPQSAPKSEESSAEERISLLPRSTSASSIHSYGSFLAVPKAHDTHENKIDFSRPVIWERESLKEAKEFYDRQSQRINDPSSRLKLHFRRLSVLLGEALQCQKYLNIATLSQKGDQQAAYYNAFMFYYREAIAALQNDHPNYPVVEVLCQQALESMQAASHFKEVADLLKPHERTGDLRITLRSMYEHHQEHSLEYSLSDFSFKREGSMRSYYHLITSPNIVGGSNIETLMRQRTLIEAAFNHLETVKILQQDSAVASFLSGW